MNKKGFTLTEMVVAISVISLLFTVVIVSITDAFGLTDEKSYEIMKKSIISSVNNYIYECDNDLLSCKGDYEWVKIDGNYKTSFSLNVLKKYSYLNIDSFVNPITDEDVSECIIVNVNKDSYSNINVSLDDSECLK